MAQIPPQFAQGKSPSPTAAALAARLKKKPPTAPRPMQATGQVMGPPQPMTIAPGPMPPGKQKGYFGR